MTRSFALILVLAASSHAAAQDVYTTPFPGVRVLERTTPTQRITAAFVDLCAPGVRVRATRPEEGGRTTSSFGDRIGAQLAVNGDFFTASGPRGLAVGDDVHWSGTADRTDHGFVAFGRQSGRGRAEVSPAGELRSREGWMRDVVGGVPELVVDGTVARNTIGPCAVNPHTGVGLSADRTELILVVVDGRAAPSRTGMTCAELGDLMRSLGARWALNLDGGGSSTFWQQGRGVLNRPSDGSERSVRNHLAVYASGAGDPNACVNRPPRGYLDEASCDGIRGWAQDQDEPDAPIRIHLYVDGPAGDPAATRIDATADQPRGDLCDAIGSCDHAYHVAIPAALRDGADHEVYAYALDTEGGRNTHLEGSPRTFRCDAVPDGGVAVDAGGPIDPMDGGGVDPETDAASAPSDASTPAADAARGGADAGGDGPLVGGCGCRLAPAGDPALGWLLIVAGLVGWRGRRTAERVW